MRFAWLFFLLLSYKAPGAGVFRRTIASPDGRTALTVEVTDRFRFSVSRSDQWLVLPSALSMTLTDGRELGVRPSVQRSRVRQVQDSIRAPVATKRRVIPDTYTELTVECRGRYALIFRVYNDGVAYRFRTDFPDSITVRQEEARFTFAGDPIVYYPAVKPRRDADRFHTSFEEPYSVTPLSRIADTVLSFSPVLVTPGVETPGGDSTRLVITESDLLDYPGMFLAAEGAALKGVFAPYPTAEVMTRGEFPQAVVTRRADYIARTTGRRSFPWRVIVVGTDCELPASDLVYRLASPSRLTDVSWIRPGQCTDEWIIGINLFNVPFRAGINTATYKFYVDFAKRFGFDRILLDAGWSDVTDLFKITPDLNMPELTAYARSQGVRLSMWTLAATLDRQLEPALRQFSDWGVDFIMTDFMDRDDQKMVNFYTRIAEACARHKIMIMFHGAYKPAGFERTYPHAVTREGVLGSEYNIWSHQATPEHNVRLPFIRMVSGPMDYEPGLLDNATPAAFRPIAGRVMSQGTRCHQLAMFLTYDSPIQIFSGNPSTGLQEPRFMEFLGDFPTTYDETRILDAHLSDYLVTARRSGANWYIGGLTDGNARDLVIDLGFLGEGSFEATICADGPNADRNAVDYTFTTRDVTRSDRLRLHVAPGGGFALRLRRR